MKKILGLAALLSAALLSSAAFARGEVPAACQADAASLCPGMAPGDGKFGKCMKSHEGQVSSNCKSAAREIRRERKEHKGEHGVPQPVNPTPLPPAGTVNR